MILKRIMSNNYRKLDIQEYSINDIRHNNRQLLKIINNACSKYPNSKFLYRSRFLIHPAKLFALLAFYNHKDFYGLKVAASRALNIDIKNIKQYWKKFDKFKDDDLFKALSSVFCVEIFGKRNNYSVVFHSVDENGHTRRTSLLDYAHLQTELVNLTNRYDEDKKVFEDILQTETMRYAKHNINLSSQRSQDVISKAVYLIYYYIYLLRRASRDGDHANLELSKEDFSKFAYGFISFYYRGFRGGRRLHHLIGSFKKYIYNYFIHIEIQECGGQFSQCGFCQFNDEYKPAIYTPHTLLTKEERYIFKRLLEEINEWETELYGEKLKLTKTNFIMLSKFSRFIHRKAKKVVDYLEYNFKWIVRKVWDIGREFLDFSKIEWIIAETRRGLDTVRAIFTGNEFSLRQIQRLARQGIYRDDEWLLKMLGKDLVEA
jgi:hypothetical protein